MTKAIKSRAKTLFDIVNQELKICGMADIDRSLLLMTTIYVESAMGLYAFQMKGPAIGPYQIEPATHDDVVDYILNRSKNLPDEFRKRFDELSRVVGISPSSCLCPRYATLIAVAKYYADPEPIPDSSEGVGQYYKRIWNSQLGKGTSSEATRAHRELIGLLSR